MIEKTSHGDTCRDCGVAEGHIHKWGCDMERCPLCGQQLIGCDCAWSDGTYAEQDEHRHSVMEHYGRVPYIHWPTFCSRCGKEIEAFFMVPDADWEHYIQIDKSRTVLCRPCYDNIKALIDAHSGKPGVRWLFAHNLGLPEVDDAER